MNTVLSMFRMDGDLENVTKRPGNCTLACPREWKNGFSVKCHIGLPTVKDRCEELPLVVIEVLHREHVPWLHVSHLIRRGEEIRFGNVVNDR